MNSQFVSSTRTLLLGAFLSIATTAGTAVAKPVFGDRPEPVAERMVLGNAAAAPLGFVEFCRRQPGDCDQSAPGDELAPASVASPTASISANDTSVAVTSDLIAPWLLNLDVLAMGAPVAWTPQLEAMKWSRADRLWTDNTPLAHTSLAAQLERAVHAIPIARLQPQASAPVLAEQTDQANATTIDLTPKTWRQINKINRRINRAVAQRTDLEIYGREEVWATPLEDGQRFGDCEDFVLEKRRALIADGFSPKALSIAVVLTPRNERHAVLLVNSEEGEYVLDNLSSWVIPWDKTQYRWRERQVAGSTHRWAGVQPAQSTKGTPDYNTQVLLASLH